MSDDTNNKLDIQMKAQILPILAWPEQSDLLHTPCEEVTDFGVELSQIVIDMFATMAVNKGIGLAAPQVGIFKKIITIRIEDTVPLILINPQVVEKSTETFQWEEGCLSVPGYFERRRRPSHIVVQYQDINGGVHEVEFRELYAFAVQHEIDHLEGKLFIDGASNFKWDRIKNKIRKYLSKQK